MTDSNGKDPKDHKPPASTTEHVGLREFIKLNRQAYGYGWDVMTTIPVSEEEAASKRDKFFKAITLLEEVDDELQIAFGKKGGYSSNGRSK